MENIEIKLPKYILENNLVRNDFNTLIEDLQIEKLSAHLEVISKEWEDLTEKELKGISLKYLLEETYFAFNDIKIEELLKKTRMELNLSSHHSVSVSYDASDKKFLFCKQHIASTYLNTIEEEIIYSNSEMEKAWIIGVLILFNMEE